MASTRPRSTRRTASIPLPQQLQAKVSLVWVKRATPLYCQLSTNVIREVCQFITFRPLLASCGLREVTVLDPIQKQQTAVAYRQVGISINYKVPPSCACIGEYELFVCGGLKYQGRTKLAIRNAFVLDCSKAVPRRDMLQGRCRHALHYHESSRRVFVFGGESEHYEDTNHCEQYDFSTFAWSPLPNLLKASSNLTTCGYQGKVFLCPSFQRPLEVFTIATLHFALVQVPMTLYTSWFPKVAVVWKSQLIVIHNKKMWRFNADTLALISQSEFQFSWDFKKQPLVANDSIFVLDQECHTIDLQQIE